jgi:hypothetical protein
MQAPLLFATVFGERRRVVWMPWEGSPGFFLLDVGSPLYVHTARVGKYCVLAWSSTKIVARNEQRAALKVRGHDTSDEAMEKWFGTIRYSPGSETPSQRTLMQETRIYDRVQASPKAERLLLALATWFWLSWLD